VHRIESPATGSYAPGPVEIKQKGTVHVDGKSVSGNGVYQDLSRMTTQDEWEGSREAWILGDGLDSHRSLHRTSKQTNCSKVGTISGLVTNRVIKAAFV
jgi:hypothetical protein